MREQIQRGSPSWRPGIRENGRVSPSYLSPTYSRPEPDRSRQVFAREVPTSGGDVRSFCAGQSRNPEGGEYRQDLYFSGLNRLSNPVHPERSLFGLMSSVPRGEYSGERRKMSVPGFSESVVGIGEKEKSTFMKKFQWDNLLVDDKPASYANANRNSYGGFCDSGAVPVSMSIENNGGGCGGSSIPCFNQRMETSEIGRNYEVTDGRYAYSSPNPDPFGVRGRASNVDSIVNKIEQGKIIDDIYTDNENAYRNTLMNDRRRMVFENNTCYAENEKHARSLNVNPENQKFVEDFSFLRNESNDHESSVYGDVVERMPMLYEELDDSSGYSYQQLVQLQEAIELRLAQNRIENNQKISLPYNWNAIEDACDSTSGGDRNWSSEEIEQLAMLENSGRAMYQGRSRGSSAIDSMDIHGNSFSSGDAVSISRRSSKSSKRDVRQRLGPALSVKQRLEFPQQVGKRQIASKNKKKYPWLKHVNERTLEDQKISVQEVKSRDEEPKENAETESKENAKIEPREDSEEFKTRVQRAFLKTFKLLNENSTDLKRYLEQGGAGKLKCCICGSSSKVFVGTVGLAQHAFFSCKSRSEHLGLYKAICVLMGWDSTIVVNGRWIQQILPSAEASSLREDLIIWPPVVLIHHSSITNDGKDNLMTVSIEGLKHFLRGMGCDPRMISICHGKAANQSTMVVSFSGTFSGLQEAEKLHKLFSEKQRGRAEFKRICSGDNKTNNVETQNISNDNKTNHQEIQNVSIDNKTNNQESQNVLNDNKTNHQETQNVSIDNETNHQESQNVSNDNNVNHRETQNVLVGDPESFLYGYMGIASDLDELEPEAKRRSVVRSKKEMEAIANASLTTQ